MFVGENLVALSYLLSGYSLARDKFNSEQFEEFTDYIFKTLGDRKNKETWYQLIRQSVHHPGHEISRFYELLDQFRKTEIKILGSVSLSRSNKDHYSSIERHDLVLSRTTGFEELVSIPPPSRLEAVTINENTHAFFYSEKNKKIYEMCLRTFPRLKEWAKDVFNIDLEQWEE